MPLLRKKPFNKVQMPANLDDDDDVFYSEITNEIFQNYEEFCERIILVNSMVWSCSMTGKTNLTYAEALQSERAVRKSLRDFPVELQAPVLFLASKTRRSGFGEMAEDVFQFVKDRYFVGELVETCFTENNWKEGHILQVIAPNDEQIKGFNSTKQMSKSPDRKFHPPASLFRYEVEQSVADDQDSSQVMIVEASQVRRKRGPFSKEKNKLFLKQYVEQNKQGMFVVKEDVSRKHRLEHIRFEEMFDGPLPDFDVSRKKPVVNGKRVKQETLVKYLKKTNYFDNGKNLIEEMRKREAEYKQKCIEIKQKKAEEKILEKQKRKEENMKLVSYVKEWNRPKEDLELEDQRVLPKGIPVQSKIPEKYFGDALMVMEFTNSFTSLLRVKDYFPGGLTLDLMERALIEKEVAGPLTDIVQMFLTTLFKIQAEEAAENKNQAVNSDEPASCFMSLSEATHLATEASKFSMRYQGLPISRLPLYSLTVTEILRLHLLASGARVNDAAAKWRYQQRGGYTSEDDPGLNLRLKHPHILKSLAVRNLNQLSMGNKVKILNCLMDQLLTYADVRDIIEERLEKSRQTKSDLRSLQTAERRREQEYMSNKLRLKREMKLDPSLSGELDKIQEESDRKHEEYDEKNRDLTQASLDNQIHLGQDRAYRRYLRVDSIPGILIENNEQFPGDCIDEVVVQKPELVNANRTDMLNYVRKLFEEGNGSDKENENEPNHLTNGVHTIKVENDVSATRDLMMCTASDLPCPVHTDTQKPEWLFLSSKEELQQLVSALNKRGVRECELRQMFETDMEFFENLIVETNVALLNPLLSVKTENGEKEKKISKKVQDMYTRYDEDANLGYPSGMELSTVLRLSVIDNILEMEEKLYSGNLGQLKVKDRDLWRAHITNDNYTEFDKIFGKKDENNQLEKIKLEEKGSRPGTPDSLYKDPGRYLGSTHEVDSDDSDSENDTKDSESNDPPLAVRMLATALLQIANAVDPKHLKRPLGNGDGKWRATEKKCDMLDQWEQSLSASTSYSQILLHYSTLDNCVMWSRSSLLARCKICHRQKDAQNMLLCDSCNKGHHIYCLKPKLREIPKGDWFCNKCKPAEVLPAPRTRRRVRKIFTENSDDDDDDDDEEEEKIETPKQNGSYKPPKEQLCEGCGSGGDIFSCVFCSKSYHVECVQPPMRRPPRGNWQCSKCKSKMMNNHRESVDGVSDDDLMGEVAQRGGGIMNRRRCAAKARDKIHGFVQSLRRTSVDSGSSDDMPIQRRSVRRTHDKFSEDDLPLHNATLQELFSDVMKHEDSWPFTRPVLKTEVPDYYDVITKPMDFGKVKYKLNMGEYKNDDQVMRDCALVFDNCNTYNNSDAPVYQCGLRLLKFFEKRCRELKLKFPKGLMDADGDADAPTKPKRTRHN